MSYHKQLSCPACGTVIKRDGIESDGYAECPKGHTVDLAVIA